MCSTAGTATPEEEDACSVCSSAPTTPTPPDRGSEAEKDSKEAPTPGGLGCAEPEDGEILELEPARAEPDGSKQPDSTPACEPAAPTTASAEADGGEAAGSAPPAPSTAPETDLAPQPWDGWLYASGSGRWIPAPPPAPAGPPKWRRDRSVPTTKHVGAYAKEASGADGLQASRGERCCAGVVRPTQALEPLKAASWKRGEPRPTKRA